MEAGSSGELTRGLSFSLDTWAVIAAALVIVLISFAVLPRIPW